ncbi:MAG: hypothetical protein HZA90_05110 [Verrucomicrobia bacterium]|nr:hypothetical protein [Verrucomicrobiota bacterium]
MKNALPLAAGLAWLAVATALAQSPAAPKPRVEQVVVVFKTHFDIGYTDLASNVVKRYRTTMIDDALKVVDQNRALPPEQQFAWTIPGWPMTKITEDWPGQTPERKQKVMQAFKDGRFVVHALPFTTHTETLELEDLVRGLGHASRLSRAVGLALPRDAKMTDVPCHSWIMPTLLRHAGVDFLHLGCNAASSSPQVPRLFFWEGPDGSRLLTMYTAESYGTGLVPPADWPFKTWLALIHTGDNHGPPTPAEVKQLLDEAVKKLPGVKVRIGRLSDFADGILAEVNGPQGTTNSAFYILNSAFPTIPVVRGDMPDTWIHGPMSDPQGASIARQTRPLIAATESLNTLLGVWGVPVPDLGDIVAKAYEQSLLYGEHTWGGAQYWVTKYGAGTKWSYGDGWKADHASGRFQRLEDSWAEHTAYIEKARELVTPLLERELKSLAQAVKVDGQRIVVFNPLPWKTDGSVTLWPGAPEIKALRVADSDERVVVAHHQNESMSFIARNVPPLGFRTYVPTAAFDEPSKVSFDEAAGTIESPFFKVTLDTNRMILRSVIDKRSGRELVDASAAQGFGQYLYERFDSNNVAAYVKSYVKISADWAVNELGKPSMPPASQQAYAADSPAGFRPQFRKTGDSAEVVGTRPLSSTPGHSVAVVVKLSAHGPFLDFFLTITKPADPWPEAGWLCLPFKVDLPQFRLGRPGSVVDPVKDIVRGANYDLFAINTGAAIFDPDGHGVGLCPLDSALVSLDRPGCWQYSREFVPKKPVAYVNLFNNQWTTNFRLWNKGTWTARVRLWSFDQYDAESSLITPSLATRFPLQAAVVDGAGGTLPASQRGLELANKGVLVTAFGPNPDGPGTLLRLWELAGQSAPCLVRLPGGMKVQSVQPVDLRGRPNGPAIPVKADSFEVPLRAFAPVSFTLR